MRKSARQQAKADLRNGTAEPVEDLSGELLELLERQIAEVEERIGSLLANEAVLAETAAILQSVPGIGPVVCAMPAAEMPELGQISGEQAAALAGLAPVAPMRPASSRACRLDPQQGLEAAQGCRHGRRPQARRDRQRLVQIPPALGGAIRMTDRGPSAEAGWGRGNVDNPFRRFRPCLGPGLDCPHSHGPNQKESYMKKPRRAVAEWKAPNRDRPPTAESVGSVVNPAPERETEKWRK